MNSGLGNNTGTLPVNASWRTDVVTIERNLPSSLGGYRRWHRLELTIDGHEEYYLPGEVCDPIGDEWFCINEDRPRSGVELLGMRLICRERHANLLLNVPPDQHGMIPDCYVTALRWLTNATDRA